MNMPSFINHRPIHAYLGCFCVCLPWQTAAVNVLHNSSLREFQQVSIVCTCIDSDHFFKMVASSLVGAPTIAIPGYYQSLKFCQSDEWNGLSALCAFPQVVFWSAFLWHLCIDLLIICIVLVYEPLTHTASFFSLGCWELGDMNAMSVTCCWVSSLPVICLFTFLVVLYHVKTTLFMQSVSSVASFVAPVFSREVPSSLR